MNCLNDVDYATVVLDNPHFYSSFMKSRLELEMDNLTDASSVTGTADSTRAPELTLCYF